MTKSLSTCKKPRKQYMSEFHKEILKVAARLSVTAVAREPGCVPQLHNLR